MCGQIYSQVTNSEIERNQLFLAVQVTPRNLKAPRLLPGSELPRRQSTLPRFCMNRTRPRRGRDTSNAAPAIRSRNAAHASTAPTRTKASLQGHQRRTSGSPRPRYSFIRRGSELFSSDRSSGRLGLNGITWRNSDE